MKILTITALYPNPHQPTFGIFVENRQRRLARSGVDVRVIAPVPYFPLPRSGVDHYGLKPHIPDDEIRHGLKISHPGYLTIPRIGMRLQPGLMARAVINEIKRLRLSPDDFDLIDAHYAYPDGIAARTVARRFGKPFTVTVRGSDINQIMEIPFARRRLISMFDDADGLIAVSDALRQKMIQAGASPKKCVTLRNGVDLDQFTPDARDQHRETLGVDGPLILSVGALNDNKGHHLIIDAVAALPGVRLMIAGDGPNRAALHGQIERLALADRVSLLGPLGHSDLPRYYAAADLTVLASEREGMANVLLESLASGTPVVATAVGGSPEVIAAPEAGLLTERSANAIRAAIQQILADPPARASTRAYGERFSWDATIAGLISVYRKIIDGPR